MDTPHRTFNCRCLPLPKTGLTMADIHRAHRALKGPRRWTLDPDRNLWVCGGMVLSCEMVMRASIHWRMGETSIARIDYELDSLWAEADYRRSLRRVRRLIRMAGVL